MIYFEEAALRAKQVLKLKTDRDLANLLELSPVAWVGRKKRGNFPETELYALAAKRPDLLLDVSYVLTGIEASAQALLDAMDKRIGGMVERGMSIEEIRAAEARLDPANVDATTALLHRLPAKDRAAMYQLALSLVSAYERVKTLSIPSKPTRLTPNK